jgi:hypothetical protein
LSVMSKGPELVTIWGLSAALSAALIDQRLVFNMGLR